MQYKERLRLYKRWPCSTYSLNRINWRECSVTWSAVYLSHMNHVSVSPTDGTGPTQGQRKTLTRVGIEPTTFGLDLRRSTDWATRSDGSRPWELKMLKSRQSRGKVVGSIPTLVRVFLCPCVGPVPSVGLTLTWFIWDKYTALHVTLRSLQLFRCNSLLLILSKLYILSVHE